MVPTWASKAIQGLSDHSGVTSQKILEVALRDGIQLVGKPLGAWVNYQKSSEKLWNEHLTNPQKDPGKKPEPAFNDIAPDQFSNPDPGDFGFERGQPIEVPEDNEVIQSLNGE